MYLLYSVIIYSILFKCNLLTPIELKIFARQIRDAKDVTVKTLDLSSSNLNDDCLYEIAKFVTFLENVDVHNSNFTTESLEMLVKCCKKFGMGSLKSLNMRMCKMNDDCLKVTYY